MSNSYTAVADARGKDNVDGGVNLPTNGNTIKTTEDAARGHTMHLDSASHQTTTRTVPSKLPDECGHFFKPAYLDPFEVGVELPDCPLCRHKQVRDIDQPAIRRRKFEESKEGLEIEAKIDDLRDQITQLHEDRRELARRQQLTASTLATSDSRLTEASEVIIQLCDEKADIDEKNKSLPADQQIYVNVYERYVEKLHAESK